MASSSSNPEVSKPPWLDLPREITETILLKLGAVEILRTAQRVCRTWWRVCRNASMWQSIDLRNDPHGIPGVSPDALSIICRLAVDRSQGQLVDLNMEYFGTDDLLLFISERCNQLKRLRLVCCDSITSNGLTDAVQNFLLLEELHLYSTPVGMEAIEDIGFSCPHLKSFKLNNHFYEYITIDCDLEALAIAETMPKLRQLQLIGNKLTNAGVKAILVGCPHLESLDLRRCFHVDLVGELGTLCSQRIQDLRCPNDPIDDNEFVVFYGTSEDDYMTGYSDIEMASDSSISFHDDDDDSSDGDNIEIASDSSISFHDDDDDDNSDGDNIQIASDSSISFHDDDFNDGDDHDSDVDVD